MSDGFNREMFIREMASCDALEVLKMYDFYINRIDSIERIASTKVVKSTFGLKMEIFTEIAIELL